VAIQWLYKVERDQGHASDAELAQEAHSYIAEPVIELSSLAMQKNANSGVDDHRLIEYLRGLISTNQACSSRVMQAVVGASVFVKNPAVRSELIFGAYLRSRLHPLQQNITDNLGIDHAAALLDGFEYNLKFRGLRWCSSRDHILVSAIGERDTASRFESIRVKILEAEAEHNRRGQQILFDLERATKLLVARQDPASLSELVVELFIDGRFSSQVMWQLQELSRENPGRVLAVLVQLRAHGEAKAPVGGNPEWRVQRLALYLHQIETWAVEAGYLEQGEWGDLQQHVAKYIYD